MHIDALRVICKRKGIGGSKQWGLTGLIVFNFVLTCLECRKYFRSLEHMRTYSN